MEKQKGKLVLVTGPSGVSKSTMIGHIIQIMANKGMTAIYLTPDTTRKRRTENEDKNCITEEEFDENARQGLYYNVTNNNGVR
ncbi:MAG: hypothetical protein LBN07_00445 [Christensenellaceae bacterium]|jgi:ribose 1,5-bisphosphokinase PhnN|nr:hypothetical protein [Christensenellaceae bacterium]